MKTLVIDAEGWTETLDLHSAILEVIRSPDWHGKSVNALVDSIIYGGINDISPPYILQIGNSAGLPLRIMQEIDLIQASIENAKSDVLHTTGQLVQVGIERC